MIREESRESSSYNYDGSDRVRISYDKRGLEDAP